MDDETIQIIDNKIPEMSEEYIDNKSTYLDKNMFPINKVYTEISGENKRSEIYKELLEVELLNSCVSYITYGNASVRLFSLNDTRIEREIYCRKLTVININKLSKSFKIFKQQETKNINCDLDISESDKKSFNKILKQAVSEIEQKLNCLSNELDVENSTFEQQLGQTERLAFTKQDIKNDMEVAREINKQIIDKFKIIQATPITELQKPKTKTKIKKLSKINKKIYAPDIGTTIVKCVESLANNKDGQLSPIFLDALKDNSDNKKLNKLSSEEYSAVLERTLRNCLKQFQFVESFSHNNEILAEIFLDRLNFNINLENKKLS